MTDEKYIRKKVTDNLDNVLGSGYIPELGDHIKGKVRDVHVSDGKIIMVASDRVSCFDHVLNEKIPYKGTVLNALSEWGTNISRKVIRDVNYESPDPNVTIQDKLKNVGFECVVRGYVWGSLARDYETGNREKCGIVIPKGLLRYQQLEEPIFTPSTKAHEGHDEDVSLDEIAAVHGEKKAEYIKNKAIDLFKVGSKAAREKGLILIDTKFEFGYDGNSIKLIDECFTPDSSRYCSIEEYNQKMPKIEEVMVDQKFKNVIELLDKYPELKIKEESKEFVRDVLRENGYVDGKPLPSLTEEQIIETSVRYIQAFERLTGRDFDFSESSLPITKRVVNNLKNVNLIYGGCVVPIGASLSDFDHWKKIKDVLDKEKLPYTEPVFISAHKQTTKVLDYLDKMNESIEPLVFITFAGRSNGLGPVVAGNTKFPVITVPPFKDTATYMADIHSSLRMPSGLPLSTIIDPGNAVLAAKRIIDLVR
jgi:phosphoribosylaminoimidazole-succinocarboxamide synthase